MNFKGTLFPLDAPKVMGILNVTPDSFYDGGKFMNEKSCQDQVAKMVQERADFVDVGGYSTRPGAGEVSEEEEERRVIPVIQWIRKSFPSLIISIDTFRSRVAQKAVEAGASMINDISGGEQDKNMFAVVASLKVPYILMHMRGTPATMTHLTDYGDLVKEMMEYFNKKLKDLLQHGVHDVIVDPGFGFAKNVEQNFLLLRQFDVFRILGHPLMAGLSRKSMVWRTLETDPEGALNGTTALNAVALLKGASILRVHDVREAVQCVQLVSKLKAN